MIFEYFSKVRILNTFGNSVSQALDNPKANAKPAIFIIWIENDLDFMDVLIGKKVYTVSDNDAASSSYFPIWPQNIILIVVISTVP